MLFVVKITYTVSKAEIDLHLDTHRQWLKNTGHTGQLVVAGPMADLSGGVVLAHCSSRDELDTLLAQDSYHRHQVAEYEVFGFNAALRTEAFPAKWASADAMVA
jgi:uncharacterized protein YciI